MAIIRPKNTHLRTIHNKTGVRCLLTRATFRRPGNRAGARKEIDVMPLRNIMIAASFLCSIIVGCQTTQIADESTLEPIPKVITADIQAGIEKYIEEQTRLGGGYFKLPYKDKILRLKLVKVHTEFLANLGPQRHFACVDLASTEGNVYDVDFFLAGNPGAMTITETTVHKSNGQPFYVWEQKRDKTWVRAEVEDASPDLLGVIHGQDDFEFIYRATLPELTETARMWIPLPTSDAFQVIETKSIIAPGKREVLEDRKNGNRVLYLELDPEHSGKTVELRFDAQRVEKGVYQSDSEDMRAFLRPELLVQSNDEFRSIAEEVTAGKKGDLVQARAIYDHVLDRMRYVKVGPGWGKGDAVYACDARTGNCTDYHAYFIALARAVGIPARFAIGASIPSMRDEGGISGYHCWAEFHADGKWWPIDISEADKCTTLSTYFFGHHPANRIELSRGRDIVVEPGPESGPINFLAYPVLEVGGKPVQVKVRFAFTRGESDRS
jgi:transglutaminase-like putative cysteine protease